MFIQTKVTAALIALAVSASFAIGQDKAKTAEESQRSETPAVSGAPSMDAQIEAMRQMREKMADAKTPQERRALMAEHMKVMQDSMAMMVHANHSGMGNMMAGETSHCGGTEPEAIARCQRSMDERLSRMQSMMHGMMSGGGMQGHGGMMSGGGMQGHGGMMSGGGMQGHGGMMSGGGMQGHGGMMSGGGMHDQRGMMGQDSTRLGESTSPNALSARQTMMEKRMQSMQSMMQMMMDRLEAMQPTE